MSGIRRKGGNLLLLAKQSGSFKDLDKKKERLFTFCVRVRGAL